MSARPARSGAPSRLASSSPRDAADVPGARGMACLMLVAAGVLAALAVARPVVVTAGAAPPAAVGARATWPDTRLDLNRASEIELAALPGIGPSLARRIVMDRAALGPYQSVDQLARVRGIGTVLIERIRGEVVVEGGTEEPRD